MGLIVCGEVTCRLVQ